MGMEVVEVGGGGVLRPETAVISRENEQRQPSLAAALMRQRWRRLGVRWRWPFCAARSSSHLVPLEAPRSLITLPPLFV